MLCVYILDAVFGGTFYGDCNLENGNAVPIAICAFQATQCRHGGVCYLTFPLLPSWQDLLVRCCTKEGAVGPLYGIWSLMVDAILWCNGRSCLCD